MKASRVVLIEQMCRPVRGALGCAALIVLAAGAPMDVIGQPQFIYSTPYTFTTLAGTAGDSGTNDGMGSAARFNGPCGIAVDSSHNVYVADQINCTIRKVTPSGQVTTLAGLAGVPGTNDGTGSAARFGYPTGVAVDSSGNVYVADWFNLTIRKVTPAGVVTTLAGLPGIHGTNDGVGSEARFGSSWGGNAGVAVDMNSNVYVADTYNNTIRKVTQSGTNWMVTTMAGFPQFLVDDHPYGGTNDGTGSAARFNLPYGIAVDTNGNVYVADTYNSLIRKVSPNGTNWMVTTIAGYARVVGFADGTNGSLFDLPQGVAADASGNLYVADTQDSIIRNLTLIGTNLVATTLAGFPKFAGDTDGTGNKALFYEPYGMAVDAESNVYVADQFRNTIRKGYPPGSVPPPVLQPPGLSAGQFGFGITGLPNLAVEVQGSSNLVNWQVIGAYYVLTNGTNFFPGPSPPLGNQFYRVHVR